MRQQGLLTVTHVVSCTSGLPSCLVNARVTRTTACRLAALRVCFRSHPFGVDLVLPGLGRFTAGGGRGESCFEELGKYMVEQVLRTRSDGGGYIWDSSRLEGAGSRARCLSGSSRVLEFLVSRQIGRSRDGDLSTAHRGVQGVQGFLVAASWHFRFVLVVYVGYHQAWSDHWCFRDPRLCLR